MENEAERYFTWAGYQFTMHQDPLETIPQTATSLFIVGPADKVKQGQNPCKPRLYMTQCACPGA